jgi:hypothetical protein
MILKESWEAHAESISTIPTDRGSIVIGFCRLGTDRAWLRASQTLKIGPERKTSGTSWQLPRSVLTLLPPLRLTKSRPWGLCSPDRLQQGLQICVAAELIEDPAVVGWEASIRAELPIDFILGFKDPIFNQWSTSCWPAMYRGSEVVWSFLFLNLATVDFRRRLLFWGELTARESEDFLVKNCTNGQFPVTSGWKVSHHDGVVDRVSG